MSYLKPWPILAAVFGIMAVLYIATALFEMWREQHDWVVSRAVDDSACSGTNHIYLTADEGPQATREIFSAAAACRSQIVRMLHAAPNFACRGTDQLTVCEHPLNADDSTTYVRAILTRSHVLLETIPT